MNLIDCLKTHNVTGELADVMKARAMEYALMGGGETAAQTILDEMIKEAEAERSALVAKIVEAGGADPDLAALAEAAKAEQANSLDAKIAYYRKGGEGRELPHWSSGDWAFDALAEAYDKGYLEYTVNGAVKRTGMPREAMELAVAIYEQQTALWVEFEKKNPNSKLGSPEGAIHGDAVRNIWENLVNAAQRAEVKAPFDVSKVKDGTAFTAGQFVLINDRKVGSTFANVAVCHGCAQSTTYRLRNHGIVAGEVSMSQRDTSGAFPDRMGDHRVAVALIDGKHYIVDQPQKELWKPLSPPKANHGELLTTEFKPRFISPTPENLVKHYGYEPERAEEESARFMAGKKFARNMGYDVHPASPREAIERVREKIKAEHGVELGAAPELSVEPGAPVMDAEVEEATDVPRLDSPSGALAKALFGLVREGVHPATIWLRWNEYPALNGFDKKALFADKRTFINQMTVARLDADRAAGQLAAAEKVKAEADRTRRTAVNPNDRVDVEAQRQQRTVEREIDEETRHQLAEEATPDVDERNLEEMVGVSVVTEQEIGSYVHSTVRKVAKVLWPESREAEKEGGSYAIFELLDPALQFGEGAANPVEVRRGLLNAIAEGMRNMGEGEGGRLDMLFHLPGVTSSRAPHGPQQIWINMATLKTLGAKIRNMPDESYGRMDVQWRNLVEVLTLLEQYGFQPVKYKDAAGKTKNAPKDARVWDLLDAAVHRTASTVHTIQTLSEAAKSRPAKLKDLPANLARFEEQLKAEILGREFDPEAAEKKAAHKPTVEEGKQLSTDVVPDGWDEMGIVDKLILAWEMTYYGEFASKYELTKDDIIAAWSIDGQDDRWNMAELIDQEFNFELVKNKDGQDVRVLSEPIDTRQFETEQTANRRSIMQGAKEGVAASGVMPPNPARRGSEQRFHEEGQAIRDMRKLSDEELATRIKELTAAREEAQKQFEKVEAAAYKPTNKAWWGARKEWEASREKVEKLLEEQAELEPGTKEYKALATKITAERKVGAKAYWKMLQNEKPGVDQLKHRFLSARRLETAALDIEQDRALPPDQARIAPEVAKSSPLHNLLPKIKKVLAAVNVKVGIDIFDGAALSAWISRKATAFGIDPTLEAANAKLKTLNAELKTATEKKAGKAKLLALREEIAMVQTLRDVLEAQKGGEPGWVVYNQHVPGAAQRRPIIFVNTETQHGPVLARVLAHEIGHVVMRNVVESNAEINKLMFADFQKAMSKHLGQLNQAEQIEFFREWFAEMFADYADNAATTYHAKKNAENSMWPSWVVRLGDMLRTYWKAARTHLGLNETFTQFMRALGNRPEAASIMREAGWEMSPKAAMHLETVQRGLMDAKKGESRFDNLTMLEKFKTNPAARAARTGTETTLGMLREAWTMIGRSTYGFYKSQGLSIAESVHAEPGKALEGRKPIHIRLRAQVGKWDRRLFDILESIGVEMNKDGVHRSLRWLPDSLTRPWWKWQLPPEMERAVIEYRLLDRDDVIRLNAKVRDLEAHRAMGKDVDAELEAASLQLRAAEVDFETRRKAWVQKATPEVRKLIEALSDYYWDLRELAQSYGGMLIPRVKNYVTPIQLSPEAIGKDREGAIRILAEESKIRAKEDPKNPRELTDEEALADARQWLEYLENHEFVYDPTGETTLSAQFGPAFQYGRREIRGSTWNKFYSEGFVETDFAALAGVYSRKLLRRMEWQRDGGFRADDFYMTREMREDLRSKGFSLGSIQRLAADRAKYKEKMLAKLQRLEIDSEMLMQPTVKFIIEAKEKVLNGQMSMADYNHFLNRALPSSLGTLGLHLPRKYRTMSQFLMAYQAMRLLMMAFFATIMDAGVMVWRTGDVKLAVGTIIDVLRESKMTRKEKHHLYKTIGASSDAATAHVFNAAYIDGQYMGQTGINRWTEGFFRLNFMYQWTEGLRYVAATISQRYIIKHARQAVRGNVESQEMLSHLGLTAQMVLENIESVEHGTLDLSGTNPNSQSLIHAVNMYVDQSVMRPESGARPWWAGHPIGAIFWFLKGFMYQFQATVLQSIWNKAKRGNGGLTQTALQGIMAAAPMVAFTLPLTLLGFELRRQLSSLGDDDWFEEYDRRGPAGYMEELIRRSGYLGVLEMPLMMEDDVKRGNFFLSAPLGPFSGQMVEGLFQGGVADPEWWVRSLPLVPSVKFAREWILSGLGAR